MSRFGGLLRELRRQAGMTQEQLAEKSGVAVRTIRRLETGSPTDPRMGTVTSLADALDVSHEQRRVLLAAADGTEPVAVREAHPEPKVTDEPPRIPSPRTPSPRPSRAGDPVSEAADHLAMVMATRLRREEEQRRVNDPLPLPVRWRTAPAGIVDHPENIRRLPAHAVAEPLALTGGLDDLASTYADLPSGRLVLLGRGGSGKTVLALRFVLDHLHTRTHGEQVPVIFSVGSWDPTTTSLRAWLVERLLRDNPGLSATGPGGSTLASLLVESGWVLPVLDGFDELAHGLHRPAMEALNDTSMPLLLTSRAPEYERTVAAVDVLTSAAVLVVTDLTPDDLAGYLPRTARRSGDGETATRWDGVLAALRAEDRDPTAENLATVLTTPLMVTLARTVYSDNRDRDPSVLLDSARFPSPEAIEDHLLGSFVPAVYRDATPGGRRNWDPDKAVHWLGFLADHLDRRGIGDLEWWRLGDSLRRSSRILLVVIACALATAVLDWFLFLPVNSLIIGPPAFELAVLEGLIIGPTAGLAFGLVYGIMIVVGGRTFEPLRMRIRLPGRGGRGPSRTRALAARFAGGLVGGAVVGLGLGPAITILRGLTWGFHPDVGIVVQAALVNVIVIALVFGLAAGIVLSLAAALGSPVDLASATGPLDLLKANRTTVFRLIAVLAVTFAIVIAFGGRLVVSGLGDMLGPLNWNPLEDGLLFGIVGGITGGLGYAFAFTAWGQWLIFARLRLPLRGSLPWALPEFLDDAYRRGVLRQTGAVYQFRHARLQHHLGRQFREREHATAR
ncbi:XRE family transcriptional regulator [Prauserella marina]|uniref:Helix-turn-helix domain-containing protein n=1 Tax=Prauserella marina TaxID=530584 RepID=A0A222VNP7_9PSEU|nr:helix-turn-helix transcriptional regulator [Prauserella marina]ASR35545.1 XRE family transcriptional regulator [Prauserella marina]PWV84614.1 helix-turn-helix protein [Prauserella marina]SDC17660.1 Helix-turn-helix domain-containing protein [Prauserella marina]